MVINLSSRFKRSYGKLPIRIQKDFDEKIAIFAKNPFSPALKTHKLKGNLQECFSFSLRGGFRVLFDFSDSDAVDLLDVGSHKIYEKFKR